MPERINGLCLAALLLILSLCSIKSYDGCGQVVDAAMHDGTFSFSPQRRNRGFGLSIMSSRGKQTERNHQRQPQLPWLLPHKSIGTNNENVILYSEEKDPLGQDCCDAISPRRIITASLFKLRGGSNTSEVGSRSSNATDAENDKRRSDKPNKKSNGNKRKHSDKGKRKNKHKSKRADNRDEAIDDDVVDDDDELSDDARQDTDDESKTDTSSSEESSSKLFLVDPFRMNEIARYEASIAEEPSEEEANDVAAEATSDVGSDDDDNDNDSDDTKAKRRNKKGKKKGGPKKLSAKELVNESTDCAEESDSVVDEEENLRNGKRKKREQQRKGKRNRIDEKREETTKEAETTDSGAEVTPATADNVNEASEEEIDTDAADTTEKSSSFWWVDVWTQQLSDPEDIDEIAETEDTPTDVDTLLDVNVTDADETKSINDDSVRKDSKKGGKGNELASQNDESIELPTNPDGNASSATGSDSLSMTDGNDSNTTKLSENETAIVTVYQNVSSITSEPMEAVVSYVSSGAWVLIDNMITIGLASKFSSLRLSRKLRLVRKLSARITTLHGFLSGKPSLPSGLAKVTSTNITADVENARADSEDSIEEIQKRIAAIDKAREGVERAQAEEREKSRKRSFWGFRPKDDVIDLYLDSNETKDEEEATSTDEEPEEPKIPQRTPEEIEAEFQRMERVREIDRLISEGQSRLADLICEKDVLQRRPNPLFNYTTTETIVNIEPMTKDDATPIEKTKMDSAAATASQNEANATSKIEIQATRNMNFPPDDLVAEYLDMMISTRRLTKMNHTDLWKESEDDVSEGEEESIGDDLFTASADAHRLYQGSPSVNKNGNGTVKNGKKSGGGGSWLLRQSIGSRRSLGEKIGQLVETLAYKAVTASLMSFLARTISSLHGINVLKHSDIRLVLEQSPDLPPVPKDGIIRGNHQNYAEETIKTVMRSKSRRSKKRSSKASFVQQEAVTETLLSHVQISAPLLKLFPLAWQRALLGNIITLSCAIISDFLDGLHFQILGHQLSFAFRPITEVDIARHFQMAGGRFNQRRYKAAEFEAAVQATSEDLKEELKFLDSWHERALGSGVLRTQIANMIARIVLTLTDEVLSGARMDLWSIQAGGPRMLAGLEHRIEEEDEAE